MQSPDNQPSKTMSPGDIYAMLWNEYLIANAAFDDRISELQKMEFNAFNCNKHAWCAGISGKGLDLLEMARSMTLNIVNLAVDTFTPDGSESIKIDRNWYLLRYVDDPCLAVEGGRMIQARRFDPKAVWDALAEKYRGEQGAEAVYRQAAEGLLHLFGIRNNPEIERRKHGVVLRLRVFLDSLDHKFGENRLHWNCRGDVEKALLHLKTFAVWSQDDTGMRGGIVEMQHHFGDSRTLLVSRERFSIGREIKVITYHSRFEFVFSHALAEQLQIFLGLYGTVEKNAA